MKILVACEYSAIVRDAFRAKGHDAYSCDLLPSEGENQYHWRCDIFDREGPFREEWDMMIAHPPCTYLANSGVRWLKTEEGRYHKMRNGAWFFRHLLEKPISKIAIENPIMHKYAKEVIRKDYDQIVHPWMFGENESKATCLWLKNLPKLVPDITQKPDKLGQSVWRMPPSPDRQKERSRFFKGIAKAMAEQWGD